MVITIMTITMGTTKRMITATITITTTATAASISVTDPPACMSPA